MPIARMAKISILAPLDMREELVERLHQLGAVHLIDTAGAADENGELAELHHPYDPDTRPLRLAIAKSDFIIELFERFDEKKGGLISGLLKRREHLSYEEFMHIEKEIDLERVYRELEELDIEHRHAEGAISEIEEEIAALAAWKGLDCPLGMADELTSVELRLAVAAAPSLPGWEEEREKRCPHTVWEEVHRERERVFLAALVHVEEAEEFDALAAEHGLEAVRFPGKKGTAEEEAERSREKLAAQVARKQRLQERILERLVLRPKILALNDFLHNRLVKEEVKRDFLHTRRVVAVEGWVEEGRMEEVREGLGWLGMNLDVDFSPPAGEEVTPTLLTNRRRLRPAETLIRLFGIPAHSETDPTPFVAVFFILFFGMCIGDVGYGAILALAFWLALRKLDLSPSARQFVRLFFYCGVASVVVGVFTRGYFGIDTYLTVEGRSLPALFKFPGTLDLLYEPIPFMLICLALGLIHISIGVAIEMYDNMRHNSVWLGFCEQGTTLLSWLGIAVTALGYGTGVRALGTAGTYILAAGVAGVVLLSNIGSRSIAGKFFGGLYNLYGLFASTIGDVASYLRLYALGLATIAIATVVNIMAGLVWGIPVLGIIAVLVVLFGGHLFNLAVSFLSAFVHPLRLQYVEFFGKFFEDGGEPFAPFALETRRTVVDEE